MAKRALINLFQFRDYRVFLREWFAAVKVQNPRFSFRAFSQRAGLKSSNFIMLVMQGKRNLSADGIEKCALGLQLNKQEREYFRHLVHYNQSPLEEQDQHYRALIGSRRYSALQAIDRQHYEYCRAWYHAVIRELIAVKECDGTAEWIAARLRPSVSVAEVTKSLELLERLGFITRAAGGTWRQSAQLLSTGAEVPGVAIVNYHHALLDLTKTAMLDIPFTQRDVSALTLGVTAAQLPELKRRLQAFRQELLQFAAENSDTELVMQVNMQCFPVTTIPGEKK